MRDFILNVAVFVCGAVVMILELTGSRILAPYLGTSLAVWTALIGVVLACLSLGYALGGKVADRKPDLATLGLILLGAGASVGLTWLVQSPVLEGLSGLGSLAGASILAALVLFGPASVLLGMVTPMAVRLKVTDIARSGKTVGSLYALSTVGSIAGTFLAGFILLALVGSSALLAIQALVLVLLSLVLAPRNRLGVKCCVLLLVVIGVAASLITRPALAVQGWLDVDTAYNRIQIFEAREEGTDRAMRVLSTGPGWFQSAMYRDDPAELALPYARFFRLSEYLQTGFERVLVIGGGAMSYPKYLQAALPEVRVDVVEIDAAFTDLSRRHFGFTPGPNTTVWHEDARVFLNRPGPAYDVIFGDAFNSAYNVPFQLVTKEALTAMSRRLTRDGMLLVNCLSALEGDDGRFFLSLAATMRQVFPQVLVFAVKDPDRPRLVQNIVIAGLKSKETPIWSNPDPTLATLLKHQASAEVPTDTPVFTDDFAPVDLFLPDMAVARTDAGRR